MVKSQQFFSAAIFVCILFSGYAIAQKTLTSEADLKKQAEKEFSKEHFAEAKPLYSQLLSLYPKNPDYNYRYGVCMLLSSKERSGSISYLEMASKNSGVEEEVYYYLGKSYMTVNNFTAASNAFENFKKHAGSGKIKKLNVDLLISNCKNAQELSKSRKNVVIVNQQQVDLNSFYSAYVFDGAAGKILSTPENFLSAEDKHQANPTMFLTNDGQTIYYASYGKHADRGKDIYRIGKLAEGGWGAPENLGEVINTTRDEDYPFLDDDGVTLYFSSKGHNSMGGYDIFKSVYDRNSGQWSSPENAGIPINTPDDDVLFVPDNTGNYAQYASAIESDLGKIGVRKIKLGNVLNDLTVINGQFISKDQPQRRDAKISVIRIKDNGLVTSVRTDPRNGTYKLDLPPGEDYTLVIEAGGYIPHAENFSIPQGLNYISLKQEVKLEKSPDAEKMMLSNYFTVSKKLADDSTATVSNEPTNVISNEYHMNESETKLKAIDLKGRTVFVLPPKNMVDTKTGSATPSLVELPAATELALVEKKSDPEKKVKDEPGEKEEVKKNKSFADQTEKHDETVVKQDHQSRKEKKAAKTNSKKDKQGEAERNTEITKQTNDESKNENQLATESKRNDKKEKTSNENVISTPQPEVIANEKTSEADPVVIKKTAEVTKQIANEQDSVSKTQIETAKELLMKGGMANAEKAKSLFKESEDNKKQSDARISKANYLEEQAKMKEDKTTATPKEMIVEGRQQISTDKDVKTNNEGSHGEANLSETASLTEKKPVVAEENPIAANSEENKPAAKTNNAKKDEEKAVDMVSANPSKNDHATLKSGGESYSSSGKKVSENQQEATAVNETKASTVTNHAEANLKGENAATNEKKVNVSEKKSIANIEKTNQQHTGSKDQVEIARPVVSANIKSSEKIDPAKKSTEGTVASSTPSSPDVTINNNDQSGFGSDNGNVNTESSKQPAVLASQNESPQVKAANEAYHQHEQLLNESKEISKISRILENKISEMPQSPKRDSLAALSNDLNLRSIRKWQEAHQKLNEAKKEDPEVETRMQAQDPGKQNTSEQETVVNTVKEDHRTSMDVSSKPDVVAINTPEKKEAAVELTNDSKDHTISDTPGSADSHVDTTSASYPEYASTMQKIEAKQTETISVFAEGVKLNKLAQQKKEEEISSRDKANQFTEVNQKMRELKKADAFKRQADSLDALSQVKFRTAQLNTGEVVIMNHQASRLKAEMNKSSLVSKTNPVIEEKGTVVPSQNATDHAVAVNQASSSESVSGTTENTSASQNTTAKQAVKITAQLQTPPVQGSMKREVKNSADETGSKTPTQSIEKNNTVNTNTTDDAVNKTEEIKSSAGNNIKNTDPSSSVVMSGKQAEKKLEQKTNLADATKPSEIVSEALANEVVNPSVENIFNYSVKTTYSRLNPIPMDPSLPTGLVFKVQIGAFHSPLPHDAFKNLQPVSGETTRQGWIRYCVGLFKAIESANMVKAEMKNNGYKDAFVVAYYNGVRMSLLEAYALMRKSGNEEKKLYASSMAIESSHLRSLKIDGVEKHIQETDRNTNTNVSTVASSGSREISSGMIEYAVQVGVYKSANVPKSLTSLMPIYAEPLQNGLYRFITTHYSAYEAADASKRTAVDKGVKDAFIIAYKNGNKVALNSIHAATPKMNVAGNYNTTNEPVKKEHSTESSASVVVYKIQMGAYRKAIPDHSMNELKRVSTDMISSETTSTGLQIYYSGQYTDMKTAVSSKSQIVSKGIKDAFIVAFQNGKKIPLWQAASPIVKNN